MIRHSDHQLRDDSDDWDSVHVKWMVCLLALASTYRDNIQGCLVKKEGLTISECLPSYRERVHPSLSLYTSDIGLKPRWGLTFYQLVDLIVYVVLNPYQTPCD